MAEMTPGPGSPDAIKRGCTCARRLREVDAPEVRVDVDVDPACPLHGDGDSPLRLQESA